ncbi:MAG: glycosyltransferase [Clostridia bacterium]|nr:glycosyltransferase [Clostridia bacterium]
MKPKICLVCDVPNWAFDIIARKVKQGLEEKYEIIIDYYDMREKPDELYEFLEKNSDCDLIHFFWRKSLLQMETKAFKQKVEAKGMKVLDYIQEKSSQISTGVYDFLFLEEESRAAFQNVFNLYANNYCVNSKKLLDTYDKISTFKHPTAIVHDICDVTRFVPMNLERFEKTSEEELVVGWVGNSKPQINGIDLKGFHTIIKPVVQELIAEGYKMKEHYADRNIQWRTSEEMPEYYSQIDLCLCTSIHEGTPLPILESMACGVPIVSTDVGIVREAFGQKQQEYIIGDRLLGENDNKIKNVLKEKIIQIYQHREILKELSKENMESIIQYDGGKIMKEYEAYFQKCLKK